MLLFFVLKLRHLSIVDNAAQPLASATHNHTKSLLSEYSKLFSDNFNSKKINRIVKYKHSASGISQPIKLAINYATAAHRQYPI